MQLIDDLHLLNNNCSIIIVSHKMSTLRNCDDLFKIEDKKIVKLEK